MKQENSPKKEQDEMQASNYSDREFRLMIIKISNNIKKDIEP